MHYLTAVSCVNTLTKTQLNLAIQQLEHEIANYQKCIENYPSDRFEKYGKPHLAKLNGYLGVLRERLMVL